MQGAWHGRQATPYHEGRLRQGTRMRFCAVFETLPAANARVNGADGAGLDGGGADAERGGRRGADAGGRQADREAAAGGGQRAAACRRRPSAKPRG
jgi:hypothetical protein